MKLAVIGGGVTGIVTSILAKEKGYEVTLYEASKNIGGIIQDIRIKEDWYFNNTQYLDVNGICYKTIERCISSEFEVFEHNYASITESEHEAIFFEDFAQPVLTTNLPDISIFLSASNDISSRLSSYDEKSKFLLQFAKKFGNLEGLHPANLIMMQLSRIFYLNHSEEVKRLKSGENVANDMLGLPRSIINPDFVKARAALPVNGYDKMLEGLYSYLLKIGVELKLDSPVKVTNTKNKVELYSRRKPIDFDLAVWSTNPTLLLTNALEHKMSSPSMKMYCAVGRCKFIKELKPVYIQVFSLKTSIVRFFLYNDKNETKITIEGFSKFDATTDITVAINKYLRKYYNTYLLSDLYFDNQTRYTLISKGDYEAMSAYSLNLSSKRILSGSWELYGRDQKVDSIVARIGEIY